MRLFVMFDLPTNTAKERKDAAAFRKFLLNDGYYMMQYSVYVRVCNSLEAAVKHENRVRFAVPEKGSVRVLKITEKQFQNMEILLGKPIAEVDIDMEKSPVTSL